jgi:hypothetical protein
MRGIIALHIGLSIEMIIALITGHHWQAIMLLICVYVFSFFYKMNEDQKRVYIAIGIWVVFCVVVFYLAHFIYKV